MTDQAPNSDHQISRRSIVLAVSSCFALGLAFISYVAALVAGAPSSSNLRAALVSVAMIASVLGVLGLFAFASLAFHESAPGESMLLGGVVLGMILLLGLIGYGILAIR